MSRVDLASPHGPQLDKDDTWRYHARRMTLSRFRPPLALVLATCLLVGPAHASETDSYSGRSSTLADATPELNRRVNKSLDWAAVRASRQNAGGTCDSGILLDRIKAYTVAWLVSPLETDALFAPGFPRTRVSMSESIFRHFSFWETPQMWTIPLTLSSLIRMGEHFVGTDKLGHFFSEGWSYYTLIHHDGRSLNDALHWGIETEETYFGLASNGIKSYGDLLVNYQGLRFWEEAAGYYFTCEDGTWQRTRDFDFRRYLDAGWDEAVNCPEFRTEKMRQQVRHELGLRERISGVPLQCPISVTACADLVEKYGELADELLSPECIAVTRFPAGRSPPVAPFQLRRSSGPHDRPFR